VSEPLNNLTLNELYDRARLGDEAAESAMFDLLAVRFRLLARRYVGEEIAPDVGQEACLVVLRKYRTEQIQKTFEAWCQGVIKMTARSYLQKNRKQLDREKSLSEHQEPATGPRDGGLSEALRNCL
jgi:DNA-directed RNA polymerase specialized sigma24 family protein